MWQSLHNRLQSLCYYTVYLLDVCGLDNVLLMIPCGFNAVGMLYPCCMTLGCAV